MELNLPLSGITPLELRNGRWYKRDDALRFDNGVNGKVRTSIYLAELAKAQGALGLVYGGSVHAPALGRVASAAAYMGLPCTLVIGSNIETARRHDTVRVAEEAGAEFIRSSVAYNPALQKRANNFAHLTGYVQIPYGVSTPEHWTPKELQDFLEVDADQVEPLEGSEVETLVIPFGSGNAATSIFYGLAERGAASLQKVVLVGVGPDRREWFHDRLNRAGVGLDQVGEFPFEVEYLPLHPHFAEYSDRMPEHQDGIDFHPTYEGKVVRFLDAMAPDWWTRRDGTTCMWIVGGPLS